MASKKKKVTKKAVAKKRPTLTTRMTASEHIVNNLIQRVKKLEEVDIMITEEVNVVKCDFEKKESQNIFVNEHLRAIDAENAGQSREITEQKGLVIGIILTMFFAAIVAFGFMSGCSIDNYAMCKDFVDHTNSKLESCEYKDEKVNLSYSRTCPAELSSKNVDCTEFYECMSNSVTCTELGLSIDTSSCPECKVVDHKKS